MSVSLRAGPFAIQPPNLALPCGWLSGVLREAVTMHQEQSLTI